MPLRSHRRATIAGAAGASCVAAALWLWRNPHVLPQDGWLLGVALGVGLFLLATALLDLLGRRAPPPSPRGRDRPPPPPDGGGRTPGGDASPDHDVSTPIAPDDRDAVNAALEGLPVGATKAFFADVHARYGATVAAGVRQVYERAIRAPVDWRVASVDDGLGVLAELLARDYPWLAVRARENLVYVFVMTHK